MHGNIQKSLDATPSNLCAALMEVFTAWTRNGIAFLVLRNYDQLPQSVGNDLDILVDPRQLEQAERLMLSSFASHGYFRHNRVEFSTLASFFFNPETLDQVQVDLFTKAGWHSFEFLTTEKILKQRRPQGTFFIPDPVHEAIISLLTRLLYQGEVKQKYIFSIKQGFCGSPQHAAQLLAESFGASLSSEVLKLVALEQWQQLPKLQNRLKRSLVSRRFRAAPTTTLLELIQEGKRLLRRAFYPAGMVVALLGPDGSGKSSVAERVEQSLQTTFPPGKSRKVHWKPALLKRAGNVRKTVTDPHSRPPRALVPSLLYLGFHWLEFFVGSHLLFRKTCFSNGLVIVDRYFYDFYVDQRRYRLNVPEWALRIPFRFVLQPDLVFLLDAPAEVLQKRKQEVPIEESRRQRDAFKRLVCTLPNGVVVDASEPEEVVARRVSEKILFHLKDREERRSDAKIPGRS